MSTACIALVDPIRTARALIAEVRSRGLEPVIVESGRVGTLPTEVASQPVRGDTLASVAAQLRLMGVNRVLGCVDPSVTYADALCQLLNIPGNTIELSEARREKGLMGEAVRRAGLRIPQTVQTDDRAALAVWLKQARFPLVVKPVASGGTDNVHLCMDAHAALRAFDQIYGKLNLLGGQNRAALIQEYIDGTEYVVDCVSFEGRHLTVDFFAYQKSTHNGRAFIYEKERFLRADDPICRKLEPFAHVILDILGFRTGASHMELKINSRGEVVFIEVGPRLNGGDIYKLVQDVRWDGKSQVSLSVDAALGLPAPDSAYAVRREGVRVHIVIKGDGRLKEVKALPEIMALPSFTRMDLHVHPGQYIAPTRDLSDLAGWIDLTHPDERVLRRDEARLDAILARGILSFEPERAVEPERSLGSGAAVLG